MADIIHLNEDSHKLLDDWLQAHKNYGDLVTENNFAFFEKVQIIFENADDPDITIVAYYENNLKRTKVSAKQFGKVRYKLSFCWDTKQGLTSIRYKFDEKFFAALQRSTIEEAVIMMASDYVAINALFIWGNIVESKNTVAVGKTIGNDKHYFIRAFEDDLYAVKSGSHRSPSGTFPVRGHFRKYKNGKIVWIDQYIKGVEKD